MNDVFAVNGNYNQQLIEVKLKKRKCMIYLYDDTRHDLVWTEEKLIILLWLLKSFTVEPYPGPELHETIIIWVYCFTFEKEIVYRKQQNISPKLKWHHVRRQF